MLEKKKKKMLVMKKQDNNIKEKGKNTRRGAAMSLHSLHTHEK